MFLLSKLLLHLIRVGTLTLTDAEGRRYVFAGAPGPSLAIRLWDPALPRRLFLNPSLALGEAYTDGTLTVENGGDPVAQTIRQFLTDRTQHGRPGNQCQAVIAALAPFAFDEFGDAFGKADHAAVICLGLGAVQVHSANVAPQRMASW